MRHITIAALLVSTIFANNSETLASKFNLIAGTKAVAQWERVFSSDRRMQKYKLNQLSSIELNNLKSYLINHAADSDQPIVPGL